MRTRVNGHRLGMRGSVAGVAAAGFLALVALLSPGAQSVSGGAELAGGVVSTVVTTVAPTVPPTTAPVTVPPTSPRPTPTLPPVTAPATTAPTSSSSTLVADTSDSGLSGTAIALIVGALIALALIVLIIVLIARRRRSDEWRFEARGVAEEAQRLTGSVVHGLGTLASPSAAAHTWSEVDAEGARLHARVQALAAGAPDAHAQAVTARTDQTLQGLRSAIDSDRALRLGPPPPTQEQLGYSEAVVRQRASDFEQAVQDLELAVQGRG